VIAFVSESQAERRNPTKPVRFERRCIELLTENMPVVQYSQPPGATTSCGCTQPFRHPQVEPHP
jgi:hypothetical protein